jgi:IS30 family transposase
MHTLTTDQKMTIRRNAQRAIDECDYRAFRNSLLSPEQIVALLDETEAIRNRLSTIYREDSYEVRRQANPPIMISAVSARRKAMQYPL